MDLSQLAEELTQPERAASEKYPGLNATQSFANLFPLIGNEDQTRALLSAIFWQVVTSSACFAMFLHNLGIDNPPDRAGEFIIVRHGTRRRQRFDLLMLSPQYRGDQAAAFPLSQLLAMCRSSLEDFADDFSRWLDHQYAELHQTWQEGLLTESTFETQRSMLETIGRKRNFVEDLVTSQPYSIMIVHKPSTIPTA